MKLILSLICLGSTLCAYTQRLNSVNISKNKMQSTETRRAIQSSNSRTINTIQNAFDSIQKMQLALHPFSNSNDSFKLSKKFVDSTIETTNIENEKANINPEKSSETLDHIIEIQGLGNIVNSQNGSSLSPSASINTKIYFIPKSDKARLYLGYNLGAEIDSTKLDSIKLASLFLPDRSKAGYTARLEYNIASFCKIKKNNIENGYSYNTEINPFIEYNYNKVNIKGTKEDSSRIQTSTWLFGINLSHSINTKDDNNIIAIQIMPYYKVVNITAGTYNTYNAIFKETLKKIDSPQKISFSGITLGLQINKFLFSFDYQNLHSKTLQNTPINGGVFTLRATVIGDLIKL